MYSANRTSIDPIDAGITTEQIHALLRDQHVSHQVSLSDHSAAGNESPHAQYLTTGDLTETLELDPEHVLPFEVEADPHHQQVAGTLEDTLLGGQHLARALQRNDDASIEDHIPLDLGRTDLSSEQQEDSNFYIEERQSAPESSTSVAYDSAHQLGIDDAHDFEPEFEVTVEQLELEGDFLPETVDIKDEITGGDYELPKEATLFAKIPGSTDPRILDDETLDRLHEEMKRMDQQRRQGTSNNSYASLHTPSQSDGPSSNHSFVNFDLPGMAPQAGSSDHRKPQPTVEPQRSHSFLSIMHPTHNSEFNHAFDDSDTSPHSEVSLVQHRQKARKTVKDHRRDSEGSSASRPLIPLSEETGKRIIVKDRMDQLSKLIRCKMREAWGIGEDEPLPGPEKAGLEWHKGSKDPGNAKVGVGFGTFHEAIASTVYRELLNDSSIAVPASQRTLEAAQAAASVSFNNFCKRYAYQNDERWKAKSARDAKRGRRWARKDLKQKKRLKATSRYAQAVPQQILRMEYMSSEDSSEGEDSGLAPGTWQFYADMTGRQNADEKVVEVKTPHWRSAQLQNIYDRLDEIAASQTAESKGKGYTQVPLRRFKLDALRPKNPPRNAEPWMFIDGVRPPPIPRKPKRPNDTAKRRAELALLQSHQDEGGSRKKKAGLVTASPSRQSSTTNVTLDQTLAEHTTARSLCGTENETTLETFDHEHDFETFDDRLFDTIEENEHYTEAKDIQHLNGFAGNGSFASSRFSQSG
ncbi:hypothetical protein QFC19_008012 [Naganishia cerealis]|uniref:Uncharacterized protein n=1 Tax=Naganishia cerealis TaxID=610337 RepID=A0ACC2V5L7_9TREE|nr:hypothetical protein QFC19_008012 [Naganishia cerealis]